MGGCECVHDYLCAVCVFVHVDMAPDTHTHTHINTNVHTHPPQEKKKGREETEIVGLPQQHYSNASQRTPTKEREDRERERWAQMKTKAVSAVVYSILIWHATSAALCVLWDVAEPWKQSEPKLHQKLKPDLKKWWTHFTSLDCETWLLVFIKTGCLQDTGCKLHYRKC